jgi:hypothetical protein
LVKLAVLAEGEYQALIDDVVASGVEIAAIPLQVLEDMAIKLDGDLVRSILGCLGMNEGMCLLLYGVIAESSEAHGDSPARMRDRGGSDPRESGNEGGRFRGG